MADPARYPRLLGAFARFALANEMAFRANFLMRVLVEVLWLGILLIFCRVVFGNTQNVEGWSAAQFLFFVGCYYAMEGVLETFFGLLHLTWSKLDAEHQLAKKLGLDGDRFLENAAQKLGYRGGVDSLLKTCVGGSLDYAPPAKQVQS